jgi:phosphatidylserine/phosphatidylglycerophosphate/cardiolipin synthase-like enzyme
VRPRCEGTSAGWFGPAPSLLGVKSPLCVRLGASFPFGSESASQRVKNGMESDETVFTTRSRGPLTARSRERGFRFCWKMPLNAEAHEPAGLHNLGGVFKGGGTGPTKAPVTLLARWAARFSIPSPQIRPLRRSVTTVSGAAETPRRVRRCEDGRRMSDQRIARVIQGFFRSDEPGRRRNDAWWTADPKPTQPSAARAVRSASATRPETLPGMAEPRFAAVAPTRTLAMVVACLVPLGELNWLGSGQALDPHTRRAMEDLFNADFSAVRVSEGAAAAALGAWAFTLGDTIYFAFGRYQTNTSEGLGLLGHELTHVVQQRAGRVISPYAQGVAIVQALSLEAEAYAMSRRAASRGKETRAELPAARRALGVSSGGPARHPLAMASSGAAAGGPTSPPVGTNPTPWDRYLRASGATLVWGDANPEVSLNGPAIFEAHAELIVGADTEICLQTFIWCDDTDEAPCEPVRAILDGLKKLDARLQITQGFVRLFLLIDSWSLSDDDPAKRALQSIGALGLRRIKSVVRNYPRSYRNNLHSKTIVIDSQRALVTGANVQRHFNEGGWYDAAYRFEGEIAAALRAEFAEAFAEANGRLPASARPAGALAGKWPCAVIKRPTSALGSWHHSQDKVMLMLLAQARRRIRIHTPNLNVGPVADALVGAVLRGLDVEVVLSKGFNDFGEQFAGGTNSEWVARLRSRLSGRREGFDLRWYSNDGVEPVDAAIDDQRKFSSHAKYLSVDGEVVVVGSANLDHQAWYHSREVNVVVVSAEVTASWDEAFFEPSFRRAIPAWERIDKWHQRWTLVEDEMLRV